VRTGESEREDCESLSEAELLPEEAKDFEF
jgi:hypothetical protein